MPIPVELHAIELADARLLLRWAAGSLNPTEKLALSALATGMAGAEAAEIASITRGGVWMAQQTALKKMRRRLAVLGITTSSQVLS